MTIDKNDQLVNVFKEITLQAYRSSELKYFIPEKQMFNDSDWYYSTIPGDAFRMDGEDWIEKIFCNGTVDGMTPAQEKAWWFRAFYDARTLEMQEAAESDYEEILDLGEEFIKDRLKSGIKRFSPEWRQDKMPEGIRWPDYKGSSIKVMLGRKCAFEAFSYGPPTCSVKQPLLFVPKIGYGSDYLYYPAIYDEDNITAYSLSPEEIVQTRLCLKNAFGRILTTGLKLGYFVLMAAEKYGISHVTVVEENQELVDYFTENILPQSKYKDKITVINASPYEFIRSVEDDEYNYLLINSEDKNDTDAYIGWMNTCGRFKSMKCVVYNGKWSEIKLIQLLSHLVTSYMGRFNNYPLELAGIDPDDREEELQARRLSLYLEKATVNVNIKNEKDLINILQPEYIKKLVRSTPYIQTVDAGQDKRHFWHDRWVKIRNQK